MAKNPPTKLTDQLRQAIDNCGRTRYRISKETGIDESALAKFCNGHRGLSLDSLDKIAALLELQIVAPSGKPDPKTNTKSSSKE